MDDIVAYIHKDSPLNAARWRQKLHEKLRGLTTMPHSCGLAPENDDASFEIRQLIHGRYRVLFTVREQAVYILTVRHGARQYLTPSEIESIE